MKYIFLIIFTLLGINSSFSDEKLRIFIDMDGVLADFRKEANKIPNVKNPEKILDFSKFTNQYFGGFLGFSIFGILFLRYFFVFSGIFRLRFGFLAIFYVGRTILDRFSPENTSWRRISGPKHFLTRSVF